MEKSIAAEVVQANSISPDLLASSQPKGLGNGELRLLESARQGLRTTRLNNPAFSGPGISTLFAAAIATDVSMKQSSSQDAGNGENPKSSSHRRAESQQDGTASPCNAQPETCKPTKKQLDRDGTPAEDDKPQKQSIHWGYKRPRTTRSQTDGRAYGEGDASSADGGERAPIGGLRQSQDGERVPSPSVEGSERAEENTVPVSPSKAELKTQLLNLQQQLDDERAQKLQVQQQLGRLQEKYKTQTVEFNDLKEKVFTMKNKSEELFKSLAAQHEQQNSKYAELRRWEASLASREEQVHKLQDSLSVLVTAQRGQSHDPVHHSAKAANNPTRTEHQELLQKLALALGQQSDERKDLRPSFGPQHGPLPGLISGTRNVNGQSGRHAEVGLGNGDLSATDGPSHDSVITSQLYKLLQAQEGRSSGSMSGSDSLRALARHLSNPPPAREQPDSMAADVDSLRNNPPSRSITFPTPSWLQAERPPTQRDISQLPRELLPLLSSNLRETLSNELQQRSEMDRSFSDPGVRRDLPRDLANADVAALQAILRGSAEALQRERGDRMSRDDRTSMGPKLDNLTQLENLAAALSAERAGNAAGSASNLSRNLSDLPLPMQRLVEESGVSLQSQLLSRQMKHAESPKAYNARGARSLNDVPSFGRADCSPRGLSRHHLSVKGEGPGDM